MTERGAFIIEEDGTKRKIKDLDVEEIGPVERPLESKVKMSESKEFSIWKDRLCTIPARLDEVGYTVRPIEFYLRNETGHEMINIKLLMFRGDKFTRMLTVKGPTRLFVGEVAKVIIDIGDIDEFPVDAITIKRVGGEEYVSYNLENLDISLSCTADVILRG